MVTHHHFSGNCAGDRKTLVTHLTAEERLFLVHRDHPLENEMRQELSRSNVLWLPGDTIEPAAVNGNPLVTQSSRDHSETSQLLASLKCSLSHQRSSQTLADHCWAWLESISAQIPAGMQLVFVSYLGLGVSARWPSCYTQHAEALLLCSRKRLETLPL